jgi:hypothetical protein
MRSILLTPAGFSEALELKDEVTIVCCLWRLMRVMYETKFCVKHVLICQAPQFGSGQLGMASEFWKRTCCERLLLIMPNKPEKCAKNDVVINEKFLEEIQNPFT